MGVTNTMNQNDIKEPVRLGDQTLLWMSAETGPPLDVMSELSPR